MLTMTQRLLSNLPRLQHNAPLDTFALDRVRKIDLSTVDEERARQLEAKRAHWWKNRDRNFAGRRDSRHETRDLALAGDEDAQRKVDRDNACTAALYHRARNAAAPGMYSQSQRSIVDIALRAQKAIPKQSLKPRGRRNWANSTNAGKELRSVLRQRSLKTAVNEKIRKIESKSGTRGALVYDLGRSSAPRAAARSQKENDRRREEDYAREL